jgi:hypothetical protein
MYWVFSGRSSRSNDETKAAYDAIFYSTNYETEMSGGQSSTVKGLAVVR